MKIGKLAVRDSLIVLKLIQCPQEFIKNKPLLLNLTLHNKIPEDIFDYFKANENFIDKSFLYSPKKK